jgi:hypothetical protein
LELILVLDMGKQKSFHVRRQDRFRTSGIYSERKLLTGLTKSALMV